MQTNRREPIGGLPPIDECPVGVRLGSVELFAKGEAAAALKTEPWQITRDAQLLWGGDVDYKPLTRSQVWTLYCIACYRRFVYQVVNQERVRGSQIREFAMWPEEKILKLVESVGGSVKDFDQRIDNLILNRRISKIA